MALCWLSFRVKRIWNFGAEFFWVACWDFECHVCNLKNREPLNLFSDIKNQIVHLKWALVICNTCQFITLEGNINFQFVPSEHCYRTVFVHNIFCSSKKFFMHGTDMCKILLELNLTMIFIKPGYGTTFSVSLLKEILFLH